MRRGADEDDWIRFRPEERQMLVDIREYRKEKGEWPSKPKFNRWEGTEYRSDIVKSKFGLWTNAVEFAGGEPHQSRSEIFPRGYVRSLIGYFSEKKFTYERNGEVIHSNEGEAVPLIHWDSVDDETSLKIPSERIFIDKTEASYLETVLNMGYTHPEEEKAKNSREIGISLDWDAVEERLEDIIEERISFRGDFYREGEIPKNKFFDVKDEFPTSETLRNKLGKRDEWKEELGLLDERNADDVDFDHEEFFG